MRYSALFGKTIKDAPKDEVSKNSKLLTRSGFIRREVSGVYNFLPLGLKVLKKIADIVREEMNAIGGQELSLTALQNKESWQKTGRWKTFRALMKAKTQLETEYPLGPTHEEVIVPLVKQFVSSYKDLPLYLYQIQTKFRDEKRAKSGLLRGREFLMKDLYSFHAQEKDFNKFYEIMKKTYKKVFERLGLDALETLAGGGTFSQFSHEYQVITDAGEDEIIYCPKGDFSANAEVSPVKEGEACRLGHGPLKKSKAIEVGNIFPLGTKFSDAFGLTYKNKEGKDIPVIMGCYGIGISRVMGAIAEVHNDAKGIIWPKEVAPHDVYLIGITNNESRIKERTDEAYDSLKKAGLDVLYDDREDAAPGAKFADADLIGIPIRLVVSKRNEGKIEFKERKSAKSELLGLEEIIKKFKA
ncbi:MAG: hypothetical protein A3B47_03320 [Candidatus Levybacteria bacterium RIFCSPLOWO2_01_FULL_39_24]|nr:MAG: hypothetical protein A2800_02610 [Candidatus Levybacteria bacterium RIFCSPHIGHO2_01_FULL_40_16]OGH28215.1 MAG: hypothetical protein A3E12_00580 [Candidatus Levybacteria bacterium RIFCSPHIGHO2_12_FULL_39_9]OGH46650.1 MAG: hypothetical protein A3B47_03320 [Candidatus Levybacteria bacterium RIFCSPLOWO2_01_FULL_39_24]